MWPISAVIETETRLSRSKFNDLNDTLTVQRRKNSLMAYTGYIGQDQPARKQSDQSLRCLLIEWATTSENVP